MTKPPIHLESRDEAGGVRLSSPSAGRNKAVIAEALKTILPDGASVLEIASGTGEHGMTTCSLRSDISWQMSDPDARSRASQDDWSADNPAQVRKSLPIDTTVQTWWSELPAYDAIFCANMIHIAPWEAALGLAKGAENLLSDKGLAILYGPFLLPENNAQSNLEFDKSLKLRNPAWGVRSLKSVKHIFADVGFNLQTRLEMPKNNLIVVFGRGSAS